MTTNWPPKPAPTPGDDFRQEIDKLEYQAMLNLHVEARKAEMQRSLEEMKAAQTVDAAEAADLAKKQEADYGNEYTTFQAVYSAYLDVAKGQVDRSIQRADFVQKAAGAIATAYVAILGLSFSVAPGTAASPLPAVAIVPTLFLGLALVLSSFYVAFVTRPEDVPQQAATGLLRLDQYVRRDNFIVWARSAVLERAWLLQLSVICLAIGILTLPLPYIVPGASNGANSLLQGLLS